LTGRIWSPIIVTANACHPSPYRPVCRTTVPRQGPPMKDMTLSFVAVVALAVVIGLVFRWLYPLVELTFELAGLFVFVALLVKLALGKLWSLRHKPAVGVDAGVPK
jgi:hypothetical protein